MKGFWKDFKAFISKGNIIDLAIAVIIGGAFGKIVTSLVNDVIMPLISLAIGGVSISDWKWVITPADPALGITESALNYGFFIQTVLDFLIIAFFIFLAIRLMQKSKQKLEQVTSDIKSEFKRKKKRRKKGKVVEEIVVEPVVETKVATHAEKDLSSPNIKPDSDIEKTADSDNGELITAIAAIAEKTNQSNKAQEQLLSEIRDLLKNK